MSSSERSIPHLRDVFSINSYTSHYNKPEPHQYGFGAPEENRSAGRKRRDKTLTNGDIKTLERHLSMKKTIRKKIMRDLQQMYAEDPNEFRIENTTPEQLKAEVRVEALRFGERPMTAAAKKSDNFLDMLRSENAYPGGGGGGSQGRDYDYDGPQQPKKKESFWKRFTKSNR